MGRVAVFVDAGYLFAQGSTALTGRKVARINLSLSARSAVEELREHAEGKAKGCSLLRIYWYDGVQPGSPMSADQAAIADLDDTKLRLGFINSHGQQKGVDSLIVTDLIELARQKAISDAVLLSGDEDVRIGVQIAQNYGVRVHLLGIEPARGSQSRTLRQEADTTAEWDKQTVAKFLTLRKTSDEPMSDAPSVETPEAVAVIAQEMVVLAPSERSSAIFEDVVSSVVSAMTQADLSSVEAFWKTERGVPPEFDKKMLGKARAQAGRDCTRPEISQMRGYFRTVVKQKLGK